MRSLHLTTSLPYPPASGGAIRVQGIIEGLHKAGHDVTLMCFDDNHHEKPPVPHYIHVERLPMPRWTIPARLWQLVFTNQADIAGRFYDAAVADHIRTFLDKNPFDLIQFEGIETVCYLPLIKQIHPQAKLCFDTFNAEYALQHTIYTIDRQTPKRWPAALYSWLQVNRIKRFERDMCQMADGVIAVSPEDAELLGQFRPDIHILPSGIDVTHYAATHMETVIKPEHKNTLIFTGKMDYRPNVDAMLWFTDDILPLVQKEIPDVHLYIVGQKPHARIAHLNDLPYVTITGWVDSVLPYLQQGGVYIAPLRMGSGTRLKLLEAMAAGCAIVATKTACAGLLSDAKQAMMITDNAPSMATMIVNLLKSTAQQQALGQQARKQVKAHYDWSVLIPKLLAIYEQMGV